MSRTETFAKITVKGLVFENPPTAANGLTAGKYPLQNSVLSITDNVGTAEFTNNIRTDSVTLSNQISATTGSFQSITSDNATFTSLTSSNILVDGANVIGSFNKTGTNPSVGSLIVNSVILIDQVDNSISMLDVSGSNLQWTNSNDEAINVLGWVPKLAQNTSIPLLESTATNAEIVTTLNSLLTVFKTQGAFIT